MVVWLAGDVLPVGALPNSKVETTPLTTNTTGSQSSLPLFSYSWLLRLQGCLKKPMVFNSRSHKDPKPLSVTVRRAVRRKRRVVEM